MDKKIAKVVERWSVVCSYCHHKEKVAAWAIAHYHIDISYICLRCKKTSIIEAGSIGQEEM